MVSSLEEVNGFIRDTVHQPMLLSNTPRPTACQQISEGFRLSQPLEWILHYGLYEVQHSDCGAAFGFDPKAEVLPKLRLKDRDPPRISLHLISLDAVRRWFQAWCVLSPLAAMPIGDDGRYVVIATSAQFP
jgi:hypothetical protein